MARCSNHKNRLHAVWGVLIRIVSGHVVAAGVATIEDTGMQGDEIDELFVGNMSAGSFVEQEHIAELIADYAGIASPHVLHARGGCVCTRRACDRIGTR